MHCVVALMLLTVGPEENPHRVDVSKVTAAEAMPLLQGRKVVVEGMAMGEDQKLGAIEVKCKDGNLLIQDISLPNLVKRHLSMNRKVSIELEGTIRERKGICYASGTDRIAWKAIDVNGTTVDSGEWRRMKSTK